MTSPDHIAVHYGAVGDLASSMGAASAQLMADHDDIQNCVQQLLEFYHDSKGAEVVAAAGAQLMGGLSRLAVSVNNHGQATSNHIESCIATDAACANLHII